MMMMMMMMTMTMTMPTMTMMTMMTMMMLLSRRPDTFPAQLLHPPATHSPVLRKTHSQPHPSGMKSPGPATATTATKGGGKRQASPPSSSYHPRAQSIPSGTGNVPSEDMITVLRAQSIPSGTGNVPTGDAAMVAARADRLKADEHKSRSKSGSPRQVDYWSTSQQA